jgi:hypothetical protein
MDSKGKLVDLITLVFGVDKYPISIHRFVAEDYPLLKEILADDSDHCEIPLCEDEELTETKKRGLDLLFSTKYIRPSLPSSEQELCSITIISALKWAHFLGLNDQTGEVAILLDELNKIQEEVARGMDDLMRKNFISSAFPLASLESKRIPRGRLSPEFFPPLSFLPLKEGPMEMPVKSSLPLRSSLDVKLPSEPDLNQRLIEALQEEDGERVISLLNLKADPNALDQRPLRVAVENGSLSTIRRLLRAEASPNIKMAIDSSSLSILDLFLEYKADAKAGLKYLPSIVKDDWFRYRAEILLRSYLKPATLKAVRQSLFAE